MEEQIAKTKANLLQKIDSLKVSDDRKDMMRRVLDSLFIAEKGRLYFFDNEIDSTNQYRFKKFITLRKRTDVPEGQEADFDFCISDRMENLATGFCEQKIDSFLPLSEIEAMINQAKEKITSEINNAHYYHESQSVAPKPIESENPKTAYEMYLDNMREKIDGLDGVPTPQRARALDVLNTLSKSTTNRIRTRDAEGITEDLVLNKDSKNYGLFASTRYYDSYSGATIGRDYTGIAARGLVRYCEEHKIAIDKGLAKLKLKIPKDEKPKEQDEGPDL